MSGQLPLVVRGATTATLPPDVRSAGLARRYVTAAVRRAELDDTLDEALLLVTELVTNAVVHAGTPLELRVDTSGPGLRIEVMDHGPGSVPLVREASSTREGGRGLFLLDALASAWGTSHSPTGKTVWFLLGGEPSVRDLPAAPEAPLTGPADLAFLLALAPDLEQQLAPVQLCGELLHRTADAFALDEACLLVADAADIAWEVYACSGEGLDEAGVEAARRAASGPPASWVLAGEDLVLPLRGRSGVLGALVLPGAGALDATSTGLVRLVADRLGVVVRDERSHVAQLRSRGSLALLAEASEMFAATLDVQLAVTLATQLVVPRFAGWSAVWTTFDAMPRLSAVTHTDESLVSELREVLATTGADLLGPRLLAELSAQRTVVLSGADVPPALAAGGGDLVAVPLVARRRLLGVLLLRRAPGSALVADDLGLLLDLGRRAALSMDNARLYEERTSIAQALQASLLPPALPEVDGLELGARYAAAGEGNDVGGDFYDVFPLDGGGWALAIGDVCGKGAEAAAITGLARDVLRLLVREGRAAAEAYQRLNEAILELGDRGRFCTSALATVTTGDAGVRVRLSSAGHPPPVLVRSSGELAFVGRSGTVLGVVPDVDISEDEVVLEEGDSLVFYTDGVTERRNGQQMFGDETLLSVLRDTVGRSADATAGHLEQSVRAFGREAARDDLAVLVLKVVPDHAGR